MTDYATSLDLIARLVKQFHTNRAAYHAPEYKEADARQELIDPLFVALGWDVHNEQHNAPQYREVIPEKSLDVEGQKKAPDYAFRQFTTTRFFVEAKKPGVALKTAAGPAYQLRRYAWSAKLPFSLLTDFEELAVYDCRSRPSEKHKASVGRANFFAFEEYPDRWREIWDVFSREAVWGGSFDQFIRAGKGTSEVDAEFLREIEGWRDVLARTMALRNPRLSIDDLNDAVQRTIDRILFLRMAEDRGIEPYEQLGRLATLSPAPAGEGRGGGEIYGLLIDLCGKANAKYNAGLFDLSPKGDPITPTLSVDDSALKPIITGLYFPQCPYEFSVLPIMVLGNIYEQFLGKVIRLTASHQAKVEEKPEVRKAGGVFYTPTYIVDYIVKNTVGKLVQGKSPKQLAAFRVLDMACGSGSFLLGAYQFLLDYYLSWYVEHNPEKQTQAVWKRGDEWRLIIAEKKRILTTHIFGVDIDRQAVEVTKLSLLLKVLEGESMETLQMALPTFQERALPNLDNNIKCGNSLIGPDYFTGQLLPDADELRRVNPFDWEHEFPEAMKAGGFDCVIGNPPYLRIQGLQEYYGDQIDYFASRYQSAVKRFDLYLLFAERGYQLLKDDGRLGFICPHKFLNSDFGSGLRSFLVEKAAMETFISFGNNLVFEQASTYTGILLLRKRRGTSFRYYEFANTPIPELPSRLNSLSADIFTTYDWKGFSSRPWVLTRQETPAVLARLSLQPKTLGDICDEILVGVQSGIDNVHVLKFEKRVSNKVIRLFSERANGSVDIERDLVKPLLRGEDVDRYSEPQASYYCIYPYQLIEGKTKIIEEHELKQRFPLGYIYLKEYRKELTEIRTRQKTNLKYWYSCHRSRDMKVFESERIITPEISLGCNMTVAPAGLYHNTKVYSIIPSPLCREHRNYWLGLLNSKVMWWFLSNTGYVLRGGYFVFKTNYLQPFPIRTINFSDPADVARHDRMVTLVEQMLELHKRLAARKSQSDRDLYQRQIEATDREIDKLVYELYGLTEEEIKIIEEPGV